MLNQRLGGPTSLKSTVKDHGFSKYFIFFLVLFLKVLEFVQSSKFVGFLRVFLFWAKVLLWNWGGPQTLGSPASHLQSARITRLESSPMLSGILLISFIVNQWFLLSMDDHVLGSPWVLLFGFLQNHLRIHCRIEMVNPSNLKFLKNSKAFSYLTPI